MYIPILIYLYICIYIYILYIYIYMYIFVYIYLYLCVCVCMCMYLTLDQFRGQISNLFPLMSFQEREYEFHFTDVHFTDVQPTLLCFCGVDTFIPHLLELERLIVKRFHGLLSQEETSWKTAAGFVVEIKRRSNFFRNTKLLRRDYLDYFKR